MSRLAANPPGPRGVMGKPLEDNLDPRGEERRSVTERQLDRKPCASARCVGDGDPLSAQSAGNVGNRRINELNAPVTLHFRLVPATK